jgi:lipoate-protein ligase B
MQSLLTPPCQRGSWKQPESIIPSRLNAVDLGEIDYLRGYAYQKKILDKVINKVFADTLIFCQHPHVFTTSKLAKDKNLLIDKDSLSKEQIGFFVVDRGGDITYHGPGQLMMYPIINLRMQKKDIRWFLYNLEQVAIDFLREFGIISRRMSGHTGVWIGSRKIVSVGIGVKRWVSFHGIAVNLNTDLKFFSMIRPCGLNMQMTSLEKETGRKIDLDLAKEIILRKFIAIFYKTGGGFQ